MGTPNQLRELACVYKGVRIEVINKGQGSHTYWQVPGFSQEAHNEPGCPIVPSFRTMKLAKQFIDNRLAEPPAKKYCTILVCDMAGSGFRIMYSYDSLTWMVHNRGAAFNRAEADRWVKAHLDRAEKENTEYEVAEYTDFACRIPDIYVQEGTRVI